MKKSIFALAVLSALATPVLADPAPAAPEAGPHTFTGNLGLFSEYRFRGITQTYRQPALQGGFDYSHSSGLYAGNWNSNVSSGAGFPEGNLEMDFYGGWKASWGDFGLDLGALYYYYPGSRGGAAGQGIRGNPVDNKEVYVGASWKFISAKLYYAVDDYFSLKGVNSAGTVTNRSTSGTTYFDLSANYDLGNGWGINGHVGMLNLKNIHNGDYTDWKLGVTKDINGWVLGAAYVGTNAHGKCSGASTYQPYCFSNSNAVDSSGTITFGSRFKDAGKDTLVLSVSKTF